MNEFNLLSAVYASSWHEELNNVSNNIIKTYPFPSDQKKVEEYAASCKDLAQKASSLELLNWQHTSKSPEERGGSFMGAAGATRMAEGKIYKDGALHLIEHYNSMPDRGAEKYQFIYKSQGFELDKIRADKNN